MSYAFFIFWFLIQIIQFSNVRAENCNVSYYKSTWRLSKYTDRLASDPSFWRYQSQIQFVLTKGLALDFAVAKCQQKFDNLKNFLAGRSGPVDPQNAWKTMCSVYCLESDKMHEEAMVESGCSCLELSTQKSDNSFTSEGDWCQHNTARLLCKNLNFCGIWNCRIDDFMCPRYEYNKKHIPLKGTGDCIKNGTFRSYDLNYYIYLFILLLILCVFS